ncbi:alkene reductase, partial [Klebsiella pneumoniae]|nr:alkene reductase [Klebsiella pneumoniae]
PTAMMAEYYAQRASAGLIISEATVISEQANGYLNTPGLFTDAQVEGWKLTTQAVHDKGGLIVAQLWHVGRVSHPDLLGGETPVSASAVQQA